MKHVLKNHSSRFREKFEKAEKTDNLAFAQSTRADFLNLRRTAIPCPQAVALTTCMDVAEPP
jgi:hypothetical protein